MDISMDIHIHGKPAHHASRLAIFYNSTALFNCAACAIRRYKPSMKF